MTFKKLLEELEQGKTFEMICKEENAKLVECYENIAYDDQALNDFLENIGAEIYDYGVGFATISTKLGNCYEIPYECKPNRFEKDLPEEIVLYFDYEQIYDVTSDYVTDEKEEKIETKIK